MQRTRSIVIVLAVAMALGSCKTTSQGAGTTTQTAGLADGPVALIPEHAPALVGAWEGPYIFDNGYKGVATMTITKAKVGEVEAYFEYRWGQGSYDRAPDNGTYTGKIGGGKLNFREWDLALSRSRGDYTFKTRQTIAGQMANIRWERSGVTLTSE